MSSGIRAPCTRSRWGSICRRCRVWRGEWPNDGRRARDTAVPNARSAIPGGGGGINRATQNLVKWSARGEWEALQREAYAAHFEPVIDSLDLPDDALDVLPDDAAGMLSVFILEDFFTARFGEHGERNVIDDYLKRRQELFRIRVVDSDARDAPGSAHRC